MCLIRVTVGATILHVLAEQRVTRFFVIELDFKPVIWVVAVSAGIAKEVFMYVVFAMAVHAGIRSIAALHIGRMATAAVGISVFTKKIEVREQVIEVCFVQVNDVSTTALVLCMAGSTGDIGDIGRLSMKSQVAIYVTRNVFMAITT
jgi:hypothetical protein